MSRGQARATIAKEIPTSSTLGQGPSAPAPPSRVPFAVPGSLLGVGLVILVLVGRSAAAPPPPPAPPPPCPGPNVQVTAVERLIKQGQAKLAVGLADSYLGDPSQGPCQPDPVQLAGLRYRAALDDLLSNTSADDPEESRAAAMRWQENERKADLQQVPASVREAPMTVFGRAYSAHLFALARAAFVKAWELGAVGPGDLQQVAAYHATIRNLGTALLEQATKGKDTRAEAFATLSTGCAIARAYHVGGEACLDLKDQLGPDDRSWPKPQADDPVLQAAVGHPRPL
jgi:hypothetical protein